MSQIFICYRRDDSDGITGRIYDRLQSHFDESYIFFDNDSILAGENLVTNIDQALSQCQVFLVIIGKDWLRLQDRGRPHRQNEIDYVQLEIEAALNRDIHIIPVLVRGVSDEILRELPKGLQRQGSRKAVRVNSDQNFHGDVDKLIQAIEPHFYRPISNINSFLFEIITLNRQNELVKRQGEARYFIEKLDDDVDLEMVEIPGGQFMMGSDPSDPQSRDHEYQFRDHEYHQHRVTVPTFFMSRYTITQAQWFQVTRMCQFKQTLQPNPARFPGDNRPVEQVSWYDAVEFCQRLSQKTQRRYRLPTEAEWEYACRAGQETTFSFGSTITPDVANYDGSPYIDGPAGERRGQTTYVTEFGANPFGLSQMHGNVDEWCLDHWHDNYNGAPDDGRAWETSDDHAKRVLRGGSWVCAPWWCRSASRLRYPPGDHLNNIGFRVVLAQPTVDPSQTDNAPTEIHNP